MSLIAFCALLARPDDAAVLKESRAPAMSLSAESETDFLVEALASSALFNASFSDSSSETRDAVALYLQMHGYRGHFCLRRPEFLNIIQKQKRAFFLDSPPRPSRLVSEPPLFYVCPIG